MKIKDLKYADTEIGGKCSATVVWEDCDREPQTVFFETESAFSEHIYPDTHAFIIASIIPALYFGERRLAIDDAICPKLKDGLISAMNLLRHWWYPTDHQAVVIEAKKIEAVTADDGSKRAAFCFSGGVDSLATLYNNRLEYPKSHPGYLKDGLLIFGLEVRNHEQFQNVLKSIASIADESDLTFVPVYTNLIDLGPKSPKEFWDKFWLNEYMSAAFAAVAHAFSRRWNSFFINASHDIPNMIPHGSNPLLTSCYSSWGLQIKEEGINLSRFEKIKLIADWEVALSNLRVCNVADFHEDVELNCGRCEKCVRTMLALEAVGALQKSTVFPNTTLSPKLVDEAVILAANTLPLYEELMLPLVGAGHHELARAIERKMVDFSHRQQKEKWKKRTIDPIIEFDRTYLNGRLKRLKNKFVDGGHSLGKR